MRKIISFIIIIILLLNFIPVRAEAKMNYINGIVSGGWDDAGIIMPDGTLLTWGNNEYGQIGNYRNGDYKYDTYDELVLKPYAALSDVKSINMIGNSAYALRNDETLWTWGFNHNGKLGNGNWSNQSVPKKTLDDVKLVAPGHGLHGMAIKNDNSLWAWGWNEFYQLGDGTNNNRETPKKIMKNVIYAAVGYGYSAVIKSDHTLYLWGENSYGNLGNGNKKNQKKPVQIMKNVKQVSLGQTCSYALKMDGTLWGWGANMNGEVGDGTKTTRLKPVKIMSDVVSISSKSLTHMLALKENGTLWGWGVNNNGQLGNGTTTSSSSPIKIMSNVIAFNNGLNYSFAIMKNNTLWAWGCNNCGQLGTGDKKDRLKPVMIMDRDTFIQKGSYTQLDRYIDGKLEDWIEDSPVLVDETGDTSKSSIDLQKVYAHIGNKYLYLAVSYAGSCHDIRFSLDYNNDNNSDGVLIYNSEEEEAYLFADNTGPDVSIKDIYQDEVVELRIPLVLIGNPGKLSIHCYSFTKDDQLVDEIVGWAKIK